MKTIQGSAHGTIKGTHEACGDLASATRDIVIGAIDGAKTIGVSAEEAASAAITSAMEGAQEISEDVVHTVGSVVGETIKGVKVILKPPFK